MPTKRQRRTREHQPASELTPAQIAILLSGWCAKPPAGEDEHAGVFALGGGWGAAAPAADDGVFALFQSHDAGVIRLWKRHEPFLLSEAQRLHIQPAYEWQGRPLFFGQYVQVPWAERTARETQDALEAWNADDTDDDTPVH